MYLRKFDPDLARNISHRKLKLILASYVVKNTSRKHIESGFDFLSLSRKRLAVSSQHRSRYAEIGIGLHDAFSSPFIRRKNLI